ncbi:major pollen allergen Ole e 10-like isoform X2 [Malania oleifera]|uniref:major pollen allergen Ole e 10-like isoform X2 n=1 Tax=Malania oleifera TaxID=397392 RepID=UPI0025ADCB8B|nr:major pollen allergen Ole e 10-like isoform X2 [Malania oleifera]
MIISATMRKKTKRVFQYCFIILIMECFRVCATSMRGGVGVVVAQHEKEEEETPVRGMSPPEGNTTFLDGTTWCVAVPGVSQRDLQNALDWACGLGMANCNPIQAGGECFQPDTLLSHASYAFNTYYQQNGNSDIACNFGGTATVTKHNPSTSQSSSAPPQQPSYKLGFIGWTTIVAISVLLYLRS